MLDCFEQAAPVVYADVQAKVRQLQDRLNLETPFRSSVFTTSEIIFGDVPNLSHKNSDASFYAFEAITSFGDYDSDERGGIVLWDDDRVIPLRSGATAVFPTGSKPYSLVPVAPHETRVIFRQFCHASVLRWVDKGGRSDTQFDRLATVAEKAAWEAKRAVRGETAAKMYSKLGDLFVY
ncbi:hypothetical protein C8F04DRAFT_968427 [Mycena alexandri]|uniref:Uncharacterized protein n=1 Tax=Mycena alexandri TaxID=1745969 RepID=A0AAD6SBR8_9AGAR|nr:hypothetical protein C8F04DRAFT_968427 [Mycena alexandri]